MTLRTQWTMLALAALLAACGSDDDDGTGGSGGSSMGGANTGGAGTGGATTGGTGGGSAGTGGGSGGSAGVSGQDPCAIHCAAADMLHCEADPPDCLAACQMLREMRETTCTTEAQAYYACLSNTDVADYYCSDLYVTALRTEDCLMEEDALFACTG